MLYVDPLGMQHSGAIVGQSDDGQWFLIRSDQFVPQQPDEWHFQIHKDRIDAALVK